MQNSMAVRVWWGRGGVMAAGEKTINEDIGKKGIRGKVKAKTCIKNGVKAPKSHLFTL